MNDLNLIKEPIDDIKFKYCNETGIGYTIGGENSNFPCVGHIFEAYPN
jgi:hypothetical protein